MESKLECKNMPEKAETIRIRINKEDSAFVYAIFEAQPHVLMVSTLPHQIGDRTRDLECIVPQGMKEEAFELFDSLKEELHGAFRLV